MKITKQKPLLPHSGYFVEITRLPEPFGLLSGSNALAAGLFSTDACLKKIR